MIAKEEVAQFNILKFPQIPISILCHCNDDTDKVVCTCTYRHTDIQAYRHIYIFTYLYYLYFFKFCYTNIMALFNRFYNTVLEQKVLTCKNQIFFLQQRTVFVCYFIVMVLGFYSDECSSIWMCIFQKI